MERFKTFLAVVGVILTIGMIINFVSAAEYRNNRDEQRLREFHMEFNAIHP